MKVTDFAFVGHPVSDLQRARKFYEKVLQLAPPKVLTGSLEGTRGFLEYTVGTGTLAITTDWSDGQPPEKPSVGLILEVEDFSAAVEHIEKCGIPFVLGPFEGPTCSIALIADPDGNTIGIHKRKACAGAA